MTKEELQGVDLSALNSLARGKECRPLRFGNMEYCSLDEFAILLNDLPARKKHVKKSKLSVNGRAVSDQMKVYLSSKGEGSSALKQVLITPRHYLIYKDPRIERDADHFTLGTFCHSAFLEPKLFDKVRTEPNESLVLNEGLRKLIEWYWEQLGIQECEILAEKKQPELKDILAKLKAKFKQEGYLCIKDEHRVIIDIIRKTYKTYGGGILPKLLKLADAETSFYGIDPSTGLDVKVRPDAVLLEENTGINALVSFKTTSATTIEQFARDCVKFKYDLSEGMYLDVVSNVTGRRFKGVLMVVLQTVLPWQVFALWWDAEDLESGKYKYKQALDVVAECRVKKSWPGFDVRAQEGYHGIIDFRLPEYARLALPEQSITEETE